MNRDQDVGECDDLTYGGYKRKVLQHHIEVQVPLRCIKELPLLLGEVNEHIIKCHTGLSWLKKKIYDQLLP
jgi:hypothetical protein